jgi:hypothetical protein
MGPANNGSGVNGQPKDFNGILRPDWTGVPVFVTDVRDPLHPYTYAEPVDQLRNNNHTAYTHSADVDQHGIVWTSGFGGVRGFWTRGRHHDPATGTDRWATAMDPIPFAGGSIHSNDPSFATSILEHNAFHRTQADSDRLLGDGHGGGREDVQQGGPALHHAGEHRQLHVDERRRLGPSRSQRSPAATAARTGIRR